MKRIAAIVFLAIATALAGCHSNITPPGAESVIVDNPMFLGHGGVRPETQKLGLSWYWWTTRTIDITMTPIKFDEPLTHLSTADNNFINYESYFVLQWHEPAYMVLTFGEKGWYENNLKEQYRTIVRDVTKRFQMTPIMTDPATLAKIEADIATEFRKHIASTGMKVTLINVNMGKALPDAPVIAEMNATAAQQQRSKTENQRKLAEDSRAKAESARALADNAYRREMGLNTTEFVQLEAIRRYADACAKSTCIIGTVPVVVGK